MAVFTPTLTGFVYSVYWTACLLIYKLERGSAALQVLFDLVNLFITQQECETRHQILTTCSRRSLSYRFNSFFCFLFKSNKNKQATYFNAWLASPCRIFKGFAWNWFVWKEKQVCTFGAMLWECGKLTGIFLSISRSVTLLFFLFLPHKDLNNWC